MAGQPRPGQGWAWVCLWLLALLAWSVAGTAKAQTTELRVSYCADPLRQELAQVMDCAWQAEVPPRQGWGQGARWLRLQVPASRNQPALGLSLQIRPYFLEHVALHEQGTEGRWQVREAGSRLPGSQPYAVLGGYAFALSAQPQAQTLYMQVRTANLHALGLQLQTVWRPDAAPDAHPHLDIMLQLGVLAMVLLFALFSHALHPRPVMGRFALLTANVMGCTLVGSGLLAMTLLQDHPALNRWLFDALLSLRLSLWLWASQALLAPYQAPRWWTHYCRAVHALTALVLLLLTLGWPLLAQGLLLAAILSSPLVQALAVWRTQGAPPAHQRMLLAGFLLTGALLFVALGTSLLPAWAFHHALLMVRLIDLANPLILLGLMTLQQRWQLAEFKALQDELTRSRLQTEFERRLLDERQVLIDMLVHELKNPLASISLALSSLFPGDKSPPQDPARRLLNIRRSIRDMSSVLERCTLMNTLEEGKTELRLSPVALDALVQAQVQATGQAERFVLLLDPLSVTSDAQFLGLVLSNLIENALKYSAPATPIHIRLEIAQGGHAAWLHIDNEVQPDMQPDAQQLFTRYYRHPLAQHVRGTGLGLYLVRAMCHELGVQVSHSPHPRGVRFSLEMPAWARRIPLAWPLSRTMRSCARNWPSS